MTKSTTATHVSAYILSRIYYLKSSWGFSTWHNTIFTTIPKLTAMIMLNFPKSCNITTHLKISLEDACQSKNHIQNSLFVLPWSQQYCTIICRWHAVENVITPHNSCFSSHTISLLNKPVHSKATLGDRSISFISTFVWSAIPNDVIYSQSLSSYKCNLKPCLFHSVDKDWAV